MPWEDKKNYEKSEACEIVLTLVEPQQRQK